MKPTPMLTHSQAGSVAGMFLCTVIAVGMRFLLHFDWDCHKAAMPHSPLGGDIFGEMIYLAGVSA